MDKAHSRMRTPLVIVVLLVLVTAPTLSACNSEVASASLPSGAPGATSNQASEAVSLENPTNSDPLTTPFPTRPPYSPGELVDYTAQTGDTLPALAVRFNTTVREILEANPFIPSDATTMPPGMPMKIPIYYLPFWGSPYQILPDSLFVNGPAQMGFDTQEFVNQHNGWLKGYTGYVSGDTRTGAQIVNMVAKNYSVSPRLLLALLEHQSGALSEPNPSPARSTYPLGYVSRSNPGLYMQLAWAANTLNNSYYRYRTGQLTSIEFLNGRFEHPDPWQNAATVSIQYFFSLLEAGEAYAQAVSPGGFASIYAGLFGDPWENVEPHIPGSLVQPEFQLPFQPKRTWAFTGGPHTGWGVGEPFSALDFAPPAVAGGCLDTSEVATAVAAGVVARSEPAIVVLDLDGDGDERTGWTVFYLHVGTEGRAPAGAFLNSGDPIGKPSCEGGRSTGTHIHIARKYNGEWVPAAGTLAFNLEGWIAQNGPKAYQGKLIRYGETVTANESSDQSSHIQSNVTR
jgi:LasA protease